MRELAIHCSIYIPAEEEWDEENPMSNAEMIMEHLQELVQNNINIGYQIYDVEVRDS